MAKASPNIPGNTPPSFKMEGYSVYTTRNGKTIIRAKGGPSGKELKTSPAYATTRNNNSEFGGASTAASLLGEALVSIKHLNDDNIQGALTGLIKSIFELDPGVPGSRPVVFSRAKHLIEGFQLNNTNNFDSVLKTPVTFSIDRTEHLAVLQLPQLSPGRNFTSPWAYPFFRFRINLGIVRDMTLMEGFGYKPILEDVMGYTGTFDTEWYPSSTQIIGQEVGLQILDAVFDESCHLVLSIGIEFATMAYGKIKPVRNAGCAKILGMA